MKKRPASSSSPTFVACHHIAAVLIASLAALAAPATTSAASGQASALIMAQASAETAADQQTYKVTYTVTPEPDAGGATVEMRLVQSGHLLREFDMRAPADRFDRFEGDGKVAHDGERLMWNPPASGGTLSWFVTIDHRRNESSYDAYLTSDWAIFRAEDVIPQAATRTLRAARSETTLRFNLPRGWSSLTEYFGNDDAYAISNPDRRFDRPAGWILLGKIGVRRERIAGVRVNVGAPVGNDVRRMDILALLGWTLPEIVRVFDEFPDRLTIIGASDPMWRGGLSGPGSLFIHADRPLLSENATSTLLHEVMHIALGTRAEKGADWIVEGLAEFYGLAVLQRSGTITDARYRASLDELAEWGRDIQNLCRNRSSGANTARSVVIFAALDDEIRRKSRHKKSIDDVTRALVKDNERITIDRLVTITGDVLGSRPDSLGAGKLPGCES